jgi:arsenate reductase
VDKVIFACVHNAGRSQMAAALFNDLADTTLAHAVSAGTNPADRIHPVVVDVMLEIGMNLGGSRPQRLTPELAQDAVLLVTMGCGDQCPYVPGLAVADWPLPDPQDRPVEEVRRIRDDLRARVEALVRSRGWTRERQTASTRGSA